MWAGLFDCEQRRMMASTLADNSSTMPHASGGEREREIVPMASGRRYVCEPLHLAIQLSAHLTNPSPDCFRPVADE